jgi:CelD/BcsL family acetyltransferase involved in cellulose biosynthesis
MSEQRTTASTGAQPPLAARKVAGGEDAEGVTLTSTLKSPADLTEEEVRIWKSFTACQEAFRSPFYSPHYVQAVEQVRPGVRVCIVRSGDEILAFFPFQFSGTAKRLLGAADPVGAHMTDYPGIVPAPGFRISSPRLLALCGLNRFQFSRLEESQVDRGLDGGTIKRGWINDLSDGPETYWTAARRRHKDFVRELTRTRRRLAEAHGPLAFTFNLSNVPEELERLLAHKREQYRRMGVLDPLQQCWAVNLLRILAPSKVDDCAGILSVLRAGDRWVASQIGLRNGGLLHAWFSVYDRELMKFGPGLLLDAFLIDEGWNQGLRRIDNGCGDYPYKRLFGTHQNTYYAGTWYRNTESSVVLETLASARRSLRRIKPAFHITAGQAK